MEQGTEQDDHMSNSEELFNTASLLISILELLTGTSEETTI